MSIVRFAPDSHRQRGHARTSGSVPAEQPARSRIAQQGRLDPAILMCSREASPARAQERGLARFTGRTVEAIKEYLLRWGALLMPAGAVLFVLGLAAQRRRREMKPAPSRT